MQRRSFLKSLGTAALAIPLLPSLSLFKEGNGVRLAEAAPWSVELFGDLPGDHGCTIIDAKLVFEENAPPKVRCRFNADSSVVIRSYKIYNSGQFDVIEGNLPNSLTLVSGDSFEFEYAITGVSWKR